MKRNLIIVSGLLVSILFVMGLSECKKERGTDNISLKEAFKDKFLMGVALNTRQSGGSDLKSTALVDQHFNSIVAENCMKSQEIHPEENRYDFTEPDKFVKFGTVHNMFIIGHCLLWHSQLAPWFCVDEQGNNVSADVLKERIKNHIFTIMGRYKGRVKGWDVVNEAIESDGSWRKSKFYQILGEEFIYLAFQYAHEADPSAELYYNDYSMDAVGKRNRVVEMVKNLKNRGLRIDAVGMQSHIGMENPTLASFEASINAFAGAGVKVMVTELDMSALPEIVWGANVEDTQEYRDEMNPYTAGLPDDVSTRWNLRMESFFKLLLKHSDVISRVTVWGLTDGDSWKNNWPIAGRTDYPLLFDRKFQPKPVVEKLCKLNN